TAPSRGGWLWGTAAALPPKRRPRRGGKDVLGSLQGGAQRPPVAGEPAWRRCGREAAGRDACVPRVGSACRVCAPGPFVRALTLPCDGRTPRVVVQPGESVAFLHQRRPGISSPNSHVFHTTWKVIALKEAKGEDPKQRV